MFMIALDSIEICKRKLTENLCSGISNAHRSNAILNTLSETFGIDIVNIAFEMLMNNFIPLKFLTD